MRKAIILIGIMLSVYLLVQADVQELGREGTKNLRSARNYYKLQEFDKAMDFYNKVLEENPNQIESLYNISSIYYDIKNDYKTAYDYYSRTLTAISDLKAEYEEKKQESKKEGKKYYKKYIKGEDIDEKESNSTQFLKSCWAKLYKIGYELILNSSYEEAVVKLEELYKLAPDSVMTIKLLGNAYMQIDKKDQALESFMKVLEQDPNDEQNIQMIANLHFNSGDYEQSAKYYKQAIEIAPTNPVNYFNSGLCYSNLDQKEKALEMFAKTIEYQPENKDAVYNARVLAQQLSNTEKFIEYQEMEFDLTGYDANKLRAFCFQLNTMEAWEALIKFGNKWAELAPEDSSPYQLMYLAAKNLGKKEKAAEYQKKAQERE